MSRMENLPPLELHMFNVSNNQKQTAALSVLPHIDVQVRLPHNAKPLLSSKGHLPTIPEAEHTPHDRLKAFPISGLANVPLLPTVHHSFQKSEAQARTPWTEPQAAPGSWLDGLPPELSSEPGSSRPVPHYAIPQDRTPLWSERGRLRRFSNPRNPYQQNLDLAPKAKQGAHKFSSPAPDGTASTHLPGVLPLEPWLSAPRQRASQGGETCPLAPLTPSDLAPAGSLKQVSRHSLNPFLRIHPSCSWC